MIQLNGKLAAMALIGLAFCAGKASAAPQQSRLLRLVPAGAQIVAGIEDPHNPDSHGRLLLVTHNDNLDFEDWIARTGVDDTRRVDEVIEVAGSSERGELAEHLLLVAGRFDAERIFAAAQRNGAREALYKDTRVLAIDPMEREKDALRETRWMAMLDGGSVAVFGTERMVREAIDRFEERSGVNATLAQRMSRLRGDVNSWDVLAMPSDVLARHIGLGKMNAEWSGALAGSDELVLGIHYGAKARLDFAVHSATGETPALAAMLEKPQLLQVSANEKARLEKLTVNEGRVEGSIALPGKDFDAFLERMYWKRAAGAKARDVK